jgi:hypothetical protein
MSTEPAHRLCLVCDYDLRGQPEEGARCPECGTPEYSVKTWIDHTPWYHRWHPPPHAFRTAVRTSWRATRRGWLWCLLVPLVLLLLLRLAMGCVEVQKQSLWITGPGKPFYERPLDWNLRLFGSPPERVIGYRLAWPAWEFGQEVYAVVLAALGAMWLTSYVMCWITPALPGLGWLSTRRVAMATKASLLLLPSIGIELLAQIATNLIAWASMLGLLDFQPALGWLWPVLLALPMGGWRAMVVFAAIRAYRRNRIQNTFVAIAALCWLAAHGFWVLGVVAALND